MLDKSGRYFFINLLYTVRASACAFMAEGSKLTKCNSFNDVNLDNAT